MCGNTGRGPSISTSGGSTIRARMAAPLERRRHPRPHRQPQVRPADRAIAAAHGGPGRAAPPSGRARHHYRPSSRGPARRRSSALARADAFRLLRIRRNPLQPAAVAILHGLPGPAGIPGACLHGPSPTARDRRLGVGSGESAAGRRDGGVAAVAAQAPRPDGRHRSPRPPGVERLRRTCDRGARPGGGDRRGQRRDALRTVRSAAVERGVESLEGRLRGGRPVAPDDEGIGGAGQDA